MPVCRTAARTSRYERRKPEDTVLYRLVADHLETFLDYARESYDGGLPTYVEQELRKYLRCGILAFGFLRAYCQSCGRRLLVAFSCKRRGVCPSCNARRMSSAAAYLADHVFPPVPVRAVCQRRMDETWRELVTSRPGWPDQQLG